MTKKLTDTNENVPTPVPGASHDNPHLDNEDEETKLREPSAASEDPRLGLPATFPIVGIGASAGGLDAFKKFFHAMPADSGVAFVLVPHLNPTHDSLMVDLLSKQTAMPVSEAHDGASLEPNHVYVIPPNRNLAIENQRLYLTPREEGYGATTAIDFFFRSLAHAQRERAIGIILSGTSNHGTIGLKEIKLTGGMVMVQQPESAEFEEMPRNAIATGLVDFVLPPEQLPDALVKYIRHPYVQGPSESIVAEATLEVLQRILAILRTRTKNDFRHYRKKMLLRRVQRRMGICHIEKMADYLEFLRSQPNEVMSLHNDLLIGVTDFFRDSEAFQVLQQRVIPELVARATKSPTSGEDDTDRGTSRLQLRIWIPACATGEEAYTIAMLFFEHFASEKRPANFHIFATDIDERSLETARQGIYSASISAGLSAERLQRFFTKVDPKHWQVNKQLREAITFAPQNLITDAPFSRLDLISCRNLLIYFEPEVQAKVIRLFHFALADGGYLMLGPSESVGRDVDLFEPVSKKWRVFRRTGPLRRELVDIPIVATDARRRLRVAPAPSSVVPAIGLKELMHRLILEQFAPAAALINRKHEIVCMIGPLVNYLEFPPGEPTNDLLAMARAGLRTKIRTSVYRAIQTGDMVTDGDARVRRNGGYVACQITVKPVVDPKDAEGLLMVAFQDRDTSSASSPKSHTGADDDSQLLQHLEHELKATREDLQSTIEEYESSTEELRASHEEVMSVNEELQSANEELETSKEELQSLNEELRTVNNQLSEKVDELDRSNSDLTNLMSSSQIATLFLDTELRVKRFTPSLATLLTLRAGDIDRPLADFAPKFADDSLINDCRTVLEKLTPIEKEVWAKTTDSIGFKAVQAGGLDAAPRTDARSSVGMSESRCYLRRILPYRSSDNRIDGIVVTLVDITDRVASEALSRRLGTVLMDSNDAVTLQDLSGRILAWNRGAKQIYGYSESEAFQMNIRDTVPQDKRMEALAYVERLANGEQVSTFETQRVTKDGRVIDIEMTATVVRSEQGKPIGVATTERDITTRKQTAIALQRLNDSLEQRVTEQTREIRLLAEAMSNLGEGVMITDTNLDAPGPKLIFINAAVCRMTGYSNAELIGQTPRIFQGQLTSREARDRIKEELAAGRSCLVELVNYRKDGSTFDLELFTSPVRNAEGKITHFVSVNRDITARKAAEKLVREREERLRAILNTAADAIITIDQRGAITAINPATLQMFGYEHEELVGQNVKVLMPPPFRDEHDSYLSRFQQTGMRNVIGRNRQLRGRRKDGSEFPIELAVSQVDHLNLFTGIIRDISQRNELQKRIIEIASYEQRRIGQELHDGSGQELTGLTLIASTLTELLNKDPQKSVENRGKWQLEESELARFRQTARRLYDGLVTAHAHIQQLSHGIMPVQIAGDGLMSALEELATAMSIPQRLRCQFDCTERIVVTDNTVATHLYRIAQEAVNNAIRHGHANDIRISLFKTENTLVLEVGDNGCGIAETLPSPDSNAGVLRGRGLQTMEYRAGLIGGLLRITPQDSGGTLVRCMVTLGN